MSDAYIAAEWFRAPFATLKNGGISHDCNWARETLVKSQENKGPVEAVGHIVILSSTCTAGDSPQRRHLKDICSYYGGILLECGYRYIKRFITPNLSAFISRNINELGIDNCYSCILCSILIIKFIEN